MGKHAARITRESVGKAAGAGEQTVLFNPLNWDRHDPINGESQPQLPATGPFFGGGECKRTLRFHKDHSRIDFVTDLNDLPGGSGVALLDRGLWAPLVPEKKRPALREYQPDKKGHPPRGE